MFILYGPVSSVLIILDHFIPSPQFPSFLHHLPNYCLSILLFSPSFLRYVVYCCSNYGRIFSITLKKRKNINPIFLRDFTGFARGLSASSSCYFYIRPFILLGINFLTCVIHLSSILCNFVIYVFFKWSHTHLRICNLLILFI